MKNVASKTSGYKNFVFVYLKKLPVSEKSSKIKFMYTSLVAIRGYASCGCIPAICGKYFDIKTSMTDTRYQEWSLAVKIWNTEFGGTFGSCDINGKITDSFPI